MRGRWRKQREAAETGRCFVRLKGSVCVMKAKEGGVGNEGTGGHCLTGELAPLAKPPVTSVTLLRSVCKNTQRGGGMKTRETRNPLHTLLSEGLERVDSTAKRLLCSCFGASVCQLCVSKSRTQ